MKNANCSKTRLIFTLFVVLFCYSPRYVNAASLSYDSKAIKKSRLAGSKVPAKTVKSANAMHSNKTSRRKFEEVEIALNEKLNLSDISDLPRAPGSKLEVMKNSKRVRAQLPASEVKALAKTGADIKKLRKFVLVRGSKGKGIANNSDGNVTTDQGILDSYCEGSNPANVDIPDDDGGWAYSDIYISCAPAGATVTSIDVHYEIIHTYVSDLVVDLTDTDLDCEYRLWEMEGGSAENINETVTGVTVCNGELVNQFWTLWALDTFPFADEGYIDYWWIKVYYTNGGGEPLYIQADSYPENTVEVEFVFVSNPGRVYFSRSPACGSLDPSYDDPVLSSGYYIVRTEYTPCEDECSSVTITANPTVGSNQTKTVHLDDRQHIWCCADSWERELGVTTYDAVTGECAEAFVTVTVIPPEAGSVSPSSGNSYPCDTCYCFFSTYTPNCSYSGRVRVRFHTSGNDVIFSFDQNEFLPAPPSPDWQTVSDSFCSEGETWMNYYQVYKMALSAGVPYDFSLCDMDGVGGWSNGDGDLEMYNSSCTSLWEIDGDPGCGYNASTLGTQWEGWSPPSDGYYYLRVSDYYLDPISYTLAYRGIGIDPNLILEVNLIDYQWMYQNLPGQTACNLTATVSIIDDPLANNSYTYAWEIIPPVDVTTLPSTVSGGGAGDSSWTFAAPGCDDPCGISDSGQAFTVEVAVTGNDYGNTGTAEAQFGIALLGDVNNNGIVNSADRSIVNAFWRNGSAGSFTFRDCDVNCSGSVNSADRSIVNAIWRGALCQNEVSQPCPFRSSP